MYEVPVSGEKKSPSQILKLFCVRVVLKTANAILGLFRSLLFRKNEQPKKILVFRTGSLGDNLCAIPAIVAIRNHYPDAAIDILSNTGKSNLVSLEKILPQQLYRFIIDYRGMERQKLVELLRREKYDLVIQLPQTDAPFLRLLRDMFFFRYITRSGFGWSFSTVRFFRQTQEKFIRFPNETQRLATILEKHGVPVDKTRYDLRFSYDDEIIVEKKLLQKSLPPNKDFIAIVVGAKRAQNRWPIGNFKTIIEAFNKEFSILLVGGPEDRELTQSIRSLPNVFDFCGELTPMQSAMLLSKCALVLSNDTGPMHLTYAVGTPLVALFSSRDFPGKWFPPDNGRSTVFRTPNVPCSLCLSETCGDNVCMKAIKTGMVEAAMREQLKKHKKTVV
jgi:ADP-heptose:LPS heptosyltransferase